MSCPHCCVSATRRGEDMSFDTFVAAILLAREQGVESIALGGGEPTLWKHFQEGWEYLFGRAGWDYYEGDTTRPRFPELDITVITNGTRKRNAFRMIKTLEQLEYGGVDDKLGLIMSDPFDGYHEPDKVHPDVLAWFQQREREVKSRHDTYRRSTEVFRSVRRILAQGRGADLPGSDEGCACEGVTIVPNGDIRQCGCKDSPVLGHVSRGIDYRYLASYLPQPGRRRAHGLLH